MLFRQFYFLHSEEGCWYYVIQKIVFPTGYTRNFFFKIDDGNNTNVPVVFFFFTILLTENFVGILYPMETSYYILICVCQLFKKM